MVTLPKTALVSLVMMSTWANFGTTAVLYMASLSAISEELYEAAEIDGAGVWKRIRHITLPALKPTILILLLMQLIFTIASPAGTDGYDGWRAEQCNHDGDVHGLQLRFCLRGIRKSGALGILLFIFLMVLSLVYVKANKLVEKEAR